MNVSNYLFNSPIGILEFCVQNDLLISLRPSNEDFVQAKETPYSKKIKDELGEYFAGKRRIFDIKINPQGTNFQKKVWEELLKIPYGSTKTYAQIADKIGGKKYSRAVGGACNKNPIIIIIPCHRVIPSNSTLGGYEYGILIKKKLLQIEQNYCNIS